MSKTTFNSFNDLQSSCWLCPVLHWHIWQCAELQPCWSSAARRPGVHWTLFKHIFLSDSDQMLNILLSFGHQIYNNCIRTEKGYCAIQWKESSTATPDPFQMGVIASAIFANGPGACLHLRFCLHQHPRPEPGRCPEDPHPTRGSSSLPVAGVRQQLWNRRNGHHRFTSSL